jgi:hypothetical protein
MRPRAPCGNSLSFTLVCVLRIHGRAARPRLMPYRAHSPDAGCGLARQHVVCELLGRCHRGRLSAGRDQADSRLPRTQGALQHHQHACAHPVLTTHVGWGNDDGQGDVNAVQWDPSGSLLASCSDDATAKVRSTAGRRHGPGGHPDSSAIPRVVLGGRRCGRSRRTRPRQTCASIHSKSIWSSGTQPSPPC